MLHEHDRMPTPFVRGGRRKLEYTHTSVKEADSILSEFTGPSNRRGHHNVVLNFADKTVVAGEVVECRWCHKAEAEMKA